MTFIALILKNLFRQRVRTGLTVLGISMGITTVVALGVVTNSLKQSIGEIISLGGADFMVAQEGAADLSFSTLPQDTVPALGAVAGIERAEGVLFHVGRLGSNPYFFLMGREPESLAAAAPEELEGDLLAKRIGGLEHSLPEARRPQNHGAIMVLQGSGDQLGRAGRAMVHQERELEPSPATGSPGHVHLGVLQ